MKGIGDVIYTLLTSDTDVSDLIGNKVFPYLAIEDVKEPYIVYEHTGSEPTDTKDGVSCVDVKDYNIEMYTTKLSDLETLSDNVRTVLDRFKGTVEGVEIDSMRWMDEDTGYSDVDRIFLRIQTYSIRHIRS